MSRASQSPPSSFIRVCRSSASWGTSTPTTVAPSRCSTRAICSPMPRLAPVTSATRPASGMVQSATSPAVSGAVRADPDHLAGDVGRLGREQERQRRGGRTLGALGDVDELDGAAPADLLAEAAGEALECALRDPLGALDLLGRRTDDDHARAAGEAAQLGGEEVTERVQLGGVLDASRVEDQALVRLVLRELRRRGDAEDVEQAGQRLDQPAGAARRRRCRRPAARRRCSARAWSGSAGRGS